MSRFRYFVILGEMRTGSNLLETHLNSLAGVTCHGELFNPAFINRPRHMSFAGISFEQRAREPLSLLEAVRAEGGMVGFRLFHDHDPRVRAHVLSDAGCAKVVLTRNPLESYVSRKIASATDQWKLQNLMRRKNAQVAFDAAEFERHVEAHQLAQLEIQHALQTSGQSAFYIGYDDLNDLSVLNGLAAWLGLEARLEAPSRKLKKQNPEPVLEKLSNPEAVAEGLARIDRFDLGRTPNFEPRRGPMLGAAIGGQRMPLLVLPLRGNAETELRLWLAACEGVAPDALPGGFDVARLRAWKAAHPGYRSVTVLRHPLVRAWAGFQRVRSGGVAPVAVQLERIYGVSLATLKGEDAAVREAFLAWLRFINASLSGQAGVAPWPFWASQAALLDGFAQLAPPDLILREEELATALPEIAARLGFAAAPHGPAAMAAPPFVDDELLDAVRTAYRRDFDLFGFADQPAPA